jgi:acetyl/propionyl-CoA carboxylase alpha subunit
MTPPHRPIGALLVANRGEIALRIARTCRARGVRALGVFTDEDADQRHARELDSALRITDYLDGDAVVAAALRLGADAIHPGYGFLAENASFAEQVEAAGLIWVGPPPAAIRAMGSKAEARHTMTARGVPVVPGYDGEAQDDATLTAAALEIGFPVLVKASAGGGGKGMQVVEREGDLSGALAAARRLAASAFGDDRLLIEKYVVRPRHIEAQILADVHGAVVHLLERECSIQRRHQKVIEEAPSPAFQGEAGEARRAALLRDAVEAARAVGYVGAGTVEFIVGEDGAHYFLEMNTRLQVEHPVTECIAGVDLVGLQIDVAEGRALPPGLGSVRADGHAIEVRLYAEDPDAGWLPRSGTLACFSVPERPGVRVDTGVGDGVRVGTAYDPMLAKIIAHGRDREEARRRLLGALRDAVVLGVDTNLDHLIRTLSTPAFQAGALHTGFYAQHADALVATTGPDARRVALALAALAARPAPGPVPGVAPGWRSNPWPEPPLQLAIGDDVHVLAPVWRRDGVEIAADRWADDARPPGIPAASPDALFPAALAVRLLSDAPPRCVVEVGALRVAAARVQDGDLTHVQVGGRSLTVRRLPDLPAPGSGEAVGGLVAPMPGKVVRVEVAVGDSVAAGDPLVVLEAMKMEQVVRAPEAGVVAAVLVAEGAQVDGGQALVVLDPSPDAPAAIS